MLIKIENHIPLFTRYNGGWIKTIKNLDKDYQNGYSLEGEFLPVSSGTIQLHENELYLDCSIGGSRKNQEKNYTLFKIQDNDVIILQEIEDGGRDWAMLLWETIEKELEIQPQPEELVEKDIKKLDDTQFLLLMNNLRKNKKYQNLLEILITNWQKEGVFV